MAEETPKAEPADYVTWFVIVAVFLFVVWVLFTKSLKVVRHAEVMVVERLGKFHRILKPGFHFILPWVMQTRKVNWRYMDSKPGAAYAELQKVTTDRIDLREAVIDFGRQRVITKDMVTIEIDALVYFRITDPRLAVFNIQNLPDAIELLTQTTLRNIMAHITLDDTLSSRDVINAQLLSKIAKDAERWGVSIVRVEIQQILPPPDIKMAMEQQIREERERRATVLQADGDRESQIVRSHGRAAQIVLNAEGDKTSQVQRAKGESEAKILVADAEAASVKLVRQAMGDSNVRAVDYLMAVQYLETLKKLTITTNPDKVILVPSKSVDAVGAMINLNK